MIAPDFFACLDLVVRSNDPWPISKRSIDINKILDDLRLVIREGSYQGERKCIPTASTKCNSHFNTHSAVEDWRNLEKMKLNGPGR